MKVKSTIRPEPIVIDDYSVYENTNIIETVATIGETEVTFYEYEQQRHDKNDYIKSLNTQVTNAQLALVELYEIQMNTGGGE